MNKTTQSILLAAMMATAGFATAQTTSNPTPAQGGPTVQRPADAGTMPATRAEVKSEINTNSGAKVAAPAQGGGTPSGAAMPAGSGGMSANTRAEVKAQVPGGSKAGASAQGDSTVSGSMAPSGPKATSKTSAERKAARAERKAARQAKAAANSTGKGMDSGPSSPARTAPQ
ncbi:hypothetical protein [Polaromonas sp.]|uniref:hypothetical protein n=1 Tax=Polaromonas sp. TaxID=1869339 RepID=UPI00375102F3